MFAHRGIRIEYADTDGVGAEADQIRNVIDQVFARSGLSQPDIEIRMRFTKNTGGRPLQVGDWRDALSERRARQDVAVARLR